MNVELNIKGERVDTDKDTRLGMKMTGGLLRVAENEYTRSFDMSVPRTVGNDRIFGFDADPTMEGVRTRAEAVLMSGGVTLSGFIYLQNYGGERYELLFVIKSNHDWLYCSLREIPYPDTLTIEGKMPVRGGTVPRFGFFPYSNGTFNGTVGNPVTLFPSANLGYLLQHAAMFRGYSIQFLTGGSVYEDPDNYGLLLPSMDTFSSAMLKVDGNARGGWSYSVSSGQTLSDIGLTISAKRYKKGVFGANVTVSAFTALRRVKIRCAIPSLRVFSGGQGKNSDWINDYTSDIPVEFDLDAGEWFTLISFVDIHDGVFTDYVELSGGYETDIPQTVLEVLDNDGVAGEGETLHLMNSLPDMTLAELLSAFCALVCASWRVDEENRILIVETFSYALAGVGAGSIVNLDEERVLAVDRVERFLDGFARHNHVRCQSAPYVSEGHYFHRDYQCGNDILEEDSEFAVVPFNEGNFTTGDDGYKHADFEDVTLEPNGEYRYNGTASLFFADPTAGAAGTALHLQTINDLGGMGIDFGEFTRQAVTLRITVSVSLRDFTSYRPDTLVKWRGRAYIIRTAAWSEGRCQFELVRLNI